MKVMIVDDEPSVRESIARALRLVGHDVRVAVDGANGIEQLQHEPADVVVLDVMMPVLDGFETCRCLRRLGDQTPVLMLTARSSVTDRVDGFGAGADDYLSKPFALAELKARLEALHRRAPGSTYGENVLRFEDLSLDLATRKASRGARQLDSLTRTEFALLELFLHNPGVVLTSWVILDEVWGATSTTSLAIHVHHLRRKTEGSTEPRLIHSVRDVGYVLRVPDRREPHA